MFLKSNLKWLRKRKKRTQEEVAFALGLKRSTYSGYENGVGEPGVATLLALGNYFNITLDVLVIADLSQLTEFEFLQLQGKEIWPRKPDDPEKVKMEVWKEYPQK